MFGRIFFVLMCFFCLCCSTSLADESTDMGVRIGRIRAALVYYIVKFVYFSPRNSESTSEALTVCLLGEDPMNAFLGPTVDGKTAHGRSLKVKRLDVSASSQLLSGCDVVFVGQSALPFFKPFVTKIHEQSVLSICGMDEIEWGGCMIQIFEKDNKARIAVDLSMLEKYGLRASSELLAAAITR